MIDNVSVMNQVHELQVLISKLKDLRVEVPKALQVRGIIAKHFSSLNDYMKLFHTTEEFSLEQIQKNLSIEEETRIHVKKFTTESTTKVNYVEANQNIQNKNAGNNRRFSEAVKNFKNPDNPRKSRHYKYKCNFLKKYKQKDSCNVQNPIMYMWLNMKLRWL